MLPKGNFPESEPNPELDEALRAAWKEMFATGEYHVKGAFRFRMLENKPNRKLGE
jgi:hypothetical protein